MTLREQVERSVGVDNFSKGTSMMMIVKVHIQGSCDWTGRAERSRDSRRSSRDLELIFLHAQLQPQTLHAFSTLDLMPADSRQGEDASTMLLTLGHEFHGFLESLSMFTPQKSLMVQR